MQIKNLFACLDKFRFSLSELFEIRQGISVPAPGQRGSEKEYAYRMVYPIDFGKSLRTIEFDQLLSQPLNREVKPERLLTASDYLLSCKGIVRGFSLQHSAEAFTRCDTESCKGILASNHFLVLRARQAQVEMYGLPYLHNVLDRVVPRLNEMTELRSGQRALRYVTIGDVEQVSVMLPLKNAATSRSQFEEIYREWKINWAQWMASEKKLALFNEAFDDMLGVQVPEEKK
jgi:hypothetical protein